MLNLFENWNFHENLRSEKNRLTLKHLRKKKKDEITFFFYKICSIFYALERKYHR